MTELEKQFITIQREYDQLQRFCSYEIELAYLKYEESQKELAEYIEAYQQKIERIRELENEIKELRGNK